MASRSHREDSDPVLEVSAVGTATSDGEYLQHEALSPHKPHSATQDTSTVVVRCDSVPPNAKVSSTAAMVGSSDELLPPNDGDEVTANTRSYRRSRVWFHMLAFLEGHRLSALTLAVGALLLLSAALLAVR